MNTLSQSTFERPTRLQPITQGLSVNPVIFRPGGQRFCLAVERQQQVVPAVAILLLSGGPATIPRLIITIVVDSVNRMFRRWAWTNVGQELGKRMPPAITYRDAASSIVPVGPIGHIETSPEHAPPNIVFGSGRLAMDEASRSTGLPRKATAAFRCAGRQAIAWDRVVRAAITLAEPAGMVRFVQSGVPNNQEPSKALTSKVLHAGGQDSRMTFRHARSPSLYSSSVVRSVGWVVPAGCSHCTT